MTHDYKEYRDPGPPDPEWFRKTRAFLRNNFIVIAFAIYLIVCVVDALNGTGHQPDDYYYYDTARDQ